MDFSTDLASAVIHCCDFDRSTSLLGRRGAGDRNPMLKRLGGRTSFDIALSDFDCLRALSRKGNIAVDTKRGHEASDSDLLPLDRSPASSPREPDDGSNHRNLLDTVVITGECHFRLEEGVSFRPELIIRGGRVAIGADLMTALATTVI
jgi:hypothetical protein